jgi:4-hydroxy-4-methyl-2-oxoglutarate aldolase
MIPAMKSDEIAARLLGFGSATLGESGGSPLPPRIRAVWPGARLAAPAYPVCCAPGDNLALHVAVTRAPRGSALVADVGEERERGFWGEVLTVAAQARGIAGLVIDGGVRDLDALASHAFPVFASAIVLRGASKRGPGAAGRPARVGGVGVESGDWIVGDADGVTIVRGAELERVMEAARARAARERQLFAELRAGHTTLELLELDANAVDADPVTQGP